MMSRRPTPFRTTILALALLLAGGAREARAQKGPVAGARPVAAASATDIVEGEYMQAPPLRAPEDKLGGRVYRAATQAKGKKVLVSIQDRWLWLISGRDTLLSVPVAVGMNENFAYDGKNFRFATPRGRHPVLKKEEDPIWTPPDWHYYEKAVHQGLEPIQLKDGDSYALSDGSSIEVRDNIVGRTNEFGNWWPWTPGMELVFDGMIFIPPLRSPTRRVPDALGPRKLDLGDGYLIHGTHLYNTESIGQAVSHGCVRMPNDYLLLLYDLVPVGTPVYIF